MFTHDKSFSLSLAAAVFGLLPLACSAAASDSTSPQASPHPSKDQVRGIAKADTERDYCKDYGWYGDGVCDDFCLNRDPDCAQDQRTPELGGNPSIVGQSRVSMSDALAFAEKHNGATIEAKFELDDSGKLSLSVYPLGKPLNLDSERNVFQELSGDPTASPWQPSLDVFHDQEHLTRSSRDLTLVQLSTISVRDAVAEVEEYGTVYWAIPTVQAGRAGYGTYVLHESQSVYTFVDGGGDSASGIEDLGEGPGDGASDARTPELGSDLSIVWQSKITMSDALRQIEPDSGPAIEAKFEIGDDGKLSLSIYPVSDKIDVDAERQHFFELAGDPTAGSYSPSKSEFVVPDEEHLTRAARDLTLVQTASLSLLDAVTQAEQAVPGGFVYWAVPTIRGTRSGYGVYVYGADNTVHYFFVS